MRDRHLNPAPTRRDDVDTIDDIGVEEAHARFGGIDVAASLAGMLAALGLAVLLAGLVGAGGSIGYQRGAYNVELSISGLIAGLAVLVVSFLAGGWVAGRMARYDGIRNGVLAGVWFLVLAAGLGALGAWAGDRYNVFDQLRLPTWFSSADTMMIVSAVIGVVAVIAAAAIGGSVGARYHRDADLVIADPTGSGIVRGFARDVRMVANDDVRTTVDR